MKDFLINQRLSGPFVLDTQAPQIRSNSSPAPAIAGLRAIALAVVVLVAVVGALLAVRWLEPMDPYAASVLELAGNRDRGQAIFLENCAGCHGAEALGAVGPRLVGVSERRSSEQIIEQVVSGRTPPMPQFQPAPQDMADLLTYLKQL
ncbi:MAG: hypothetical protein Fur0042_28520 [Cyanophyceae cyanobacterium]